jgi:hypothetical protein
MSQITEPKHSSFQPAKMSYPCHCYNPEDAFVEDAATESVDSCADLPPLVPAVEAPRAWPTEPWAVDFFAGTHLSRSARGGGTEVIQPPLVPASGPVPAAPVKPKPLFSAADTNEFTDLYKAKKRDRLTEQYQVHIKAAIDDLLDLRGDTLKEEMRTAIERANGIENLSIALFRYTKATVPHYVSGSYTDFDGNWWTSINAYCDLLTTILGGVEVDFLVRNTHFLKQLLERIGDPQHFIIKKHVHVPEEHETHKVIHMTLQLEFWPKGVTLGRKMQCYNP